MNDLLVFNVNKGIENRSNSGREAELSELNLKLLCNEIGFIFAQEFEALSLEQIENEGDSAANFILPEVDPSSLAGLPPYIAALYSLRMLTAVGETVLFRKMNFLKYHANQHRTVLDPDDPSEELIDEIQRLLAEAERTRNQIIESNLRLVVSIARKFSTNQASFDELVSEGNTILLKAVEKFDYSRGFRFSTYVTHSVQRHFFRHFRRIQRRIKKEIATSQQILSDAITDRQVQENAPLDTVPADILLSQMDEFLDEREQFIVRARCGFEMEGTVRTFQSLSQDLGVCKERVRQLFHTAIKKLRQFAIEKNMELHPLS